MNAPAPVVSVIMPAYNVTRYIGEALDSVFAQTLQDFEIIVVNDGCPDTQALERVLDRYGEKIRYLKQENAGVAAARNTAVMAATTPFIFTLDPDDWLQADCLEFQVSFLRAHPEVDVNYINPVFRGGASNGSTWMDVYPSTGDVSFLSVMAGDTPPANPGSIIRRDALLRAGLYDPSLRSWEDFGIWLRILKSGGRITYSKAPLVNYRVREGSLTRELRYMEDAVQVLDNIASAMQLTPREREALENRRRPAQIEVERLRGKACIKRHEWSAAKRHFEYCLRHQPSMKLRLVVMCLSFCPWLLAGWGSQSWLPPSFRRRKTSANEGPSR